MKILVIPDGQNKPGVSFEHWDWVGKYIVEKKPDVIVNLGDWADMPSLSSYDKGRKSFEGRRYLADVKASKEAMEILLKPLRDHNKHMAAIKHKKYKPRMVLTLGNHEDRINRAAESQPEYDGLLTTKALDYEKDGWEVIPFRKPIVINGVTFVHYLYSPGTGKAYGGTARNILPKVSESFVVGHRQGKDVAEHSTPSGRTIRGIIAGSCYTHDEDYLGPQVMNYWRGVLMLHRVKDGNFDLMEVSLDYLKERYGTHE